MAAVVTVQLGQLGAIVTKADKAVFIHLLLSSVCQKTSSFSTANALLVIKIYGV